MTLRLYHGIATANRIVAMIVGAVLAAMAAYVIADVLLRRLGRPLGGSEELSAYVMAFAASWGLGYALVERAHVRIDLLRLRLGSRGRQLLDLVAMSTLAGLVVLVALQSWPVVAKSLSQGSRANTPLETPLWIPQSIWFAGWAWFAMTSVALLVCGVAFLLAGRDAQFDDALGTPTDDAGVETSSGGSTGDASARS